MKRKGMKRCEGGSSETMFDVACHISNEETPMVSKVFISPVCFLAH